MTSPASAAQLAEQIAKRFQGIVPDHKKLVRAITTALAAHAKAAERRTWEEAEKVHRKNIFCMASSETECPDISEFRRRATEGGGQDE